MSERDAIPEPCGVCGGDKGFVPSESKPAHRHGGCICKQDVPPSEPEPYNGCVACGRGQAGDSAQLAAYLSGLDKPTIDRIGGVSSGPIVDGCTHAGPCTDRCEPTPRPTPWVTPGEDYEVQVCPSGGRCIEAAEEAAIWAGRYTSMTARHERTYRALQVSREHNIEQSRRIEALQDERDRLRAENEGLLNGNRDLHEECQRLRRERDDAINQRKFGAANAQMDYEEQVYRAARYERVLGQIASANRNKRPDGTYNISRDALIDWAQDALKGTEYE